MKHGTAIVGVGLATFLAVVAAALARDELFQAHMWILTVVLAGTVIVLLRNTKFGKTATAGG